jgi:glutathione S-transferase
MKLIGSHTSPFVRKVRIVLAEKKIDYELVIDSPWLADSKVPDINPLGKIPVLLLDDETPLFDSRVIVEYIDNVTPNNKLFPAPNRERTKVIRGLEFMAEELGDKSFCMGTHISMADIAVGTALGYLGFRFPDIDWRTSHANLAKLYDKLMQRPPFADTVPHD